MPSRKKEAKHKKFKKRGSKRVVNKAKVTTESQHSPCRKVRESARSGRETSRGVRTTSQSRPQALLESEARYRILFNQARDGIGLINLETGAIIDCNPEFENLCGRKVKELKKMKIWELRPPGKVEPAKKKFFEIKEKGTGGSRELEFQKPNGEVVPVEFVSRAIKIQGKQYIQSIVRDITHRTRAEVALRESEEKFRNLAEQSPNMIFINKKGGVVYANMKCEEIMGYTREEFYSPDFDFLDLMAQESQDLIKTSFSKHMKGEEVPPCEYTLISKKGEKIEAILTTRLISYEGENAILGTVTDITERKRAEREIQKLNESLKLQAEELAAANRELEAFSYSVSHDLRAPLRTIDGFSRALLEDYGNKLDGPGKDYLRRVRAGTQHVRQLIDDLLNLSLAIRTQIRREETSLSELAHKIAADLEKTQPERQVQFVIQEGVFARGDPQLLQNVLENLLNNAWKFTEKNSRARIEFGETRKEEQTVYFIRDDGAGFDMTYVNKLFIPFQRLHSTAEFSGDGIGLAIAKRIIDRHGGHIWAEGEVEKGATFYFTLR